MAAKTEAPVVADAGAAAAAKGGGVPLVPLLAVLLLAPALTYAVAQFVLVPQLKAALAGAGEASAEGAASHEEAAAPAAEHGGHGGGKHGAPAAGDARSYEYSDVVVNLAGTMGTRYLKVSFIVTGTDANLRSTFEAKKIQLTDVTLNVLSSLTLADLEEAGAKNLIREKLVAAYNQAVGRKVAEQVYFSDFVVQ